MKELFKRVLVLGIGVFRVVLGLLAVSAGYQLMQRQGSFVFWSPESAIAGIFVILLGGAFIVLGIFPKLFD